MKHSITLFLLILISVTLLGLLVKLTKPINLIIETQEQPIVVNITKIDKTSVLNIKTETINNPTPPENDLVLEIVRKYAENHEYSKHSFNCQDYSCGIYSILTELGYDIKVIRGCPKQDEMCHYWIKYEGYDIEPILGELVDYSEQFPYQREVDYCR